MTYYTMVVGWSSNLGNSWAQIAAQYDTGIWNADGYFGYSSIGTVIPGAAPDPPGEIFGGEGVPYDSLVLYSVVPEPATFALAGIGGLSLLVLRCRKKLK